MKLEALLDSWDRNCRIIGNLASLVTDDLKSIRPAPGRLDLEDQFAHVHSTRVEWVNSCAPQHCDGLEYLFEPVDGVWQAKKDFANTQAQLDLSAKAIRNAVQEALVKEVGVFGPYDHPVLLLQHMIWHEGWHSGMIMLALEQAGREPDEVWEDRNIWGLWRAPEL